MNRIGMELRRRQVLSMLMDGQREGEIGSRLGISQSSVSRDLKRLSSDAEKAAKDLARLDLAHNAIWQVFCHLDEAVVHTLKEFDRTEPGDLASRLTDLHLVIGLIGRQCYLLRFAEIRSTIAEAYFQTLRNQCNELRIRLNILEEGLDGQVDLVQRAIG